MFKKQSDAPKANSFQIEASPERRPTAPPKGVSVLGPTLSIKGGELSFDEDLIIEGTVEGKIAHQGHHLTIGKNGRVKANIRARLITVYGTVEGDLHGDEGVEGGATFKGSITTGDDLRAAARPAPAPQAAPVREPLQGTASDEGRDARGRATQGAVAEAPSFAMRGSAATVTR
jgi:cytoskeletal protein CcmA (bactofilin family)